MNQLTPFRREPIELALEAPFRLARLEVTPAALELGRDEETWTAEPRVMKVLVALHRSRGHAVSREDLIDLCWDGRIVGEDSLNRGISQLRKALAAQPDITIDTIPRIGYRLRIEDTDDTATPDALADACPAKRARRKRIIITGIALLACASGAGLWRYSTSPDDLRAIALNPLTRDAGAETHPALSPDGQRIAYATGPGFGGPRDIMLRSTRLGDDTPVRLTNTPLDNEYSPAWSPSGGRLAFIRSAPGGKCSLVVMTPPSGTERVAGSCDELPVGLAWSDDQTLVFADRTHHQGTLRLVAMDIASGETRPLTSPPADSVGDSVPVVSPDGRWLAFRRTAALGSDDVYLLDLRSNTERRLTHHGWKASGFAWSGKGTLLFTGNRGGDFGLWLLAIGGSPIPRRISLGTVPLGRLSADHSGRRLAVETTERRTRLIALAPDGTKRPLVIDNGNDLDPHIAPDGALAFVSDRSGASELWVRRPAGRLDRLTDMNASFAFSPRWSPDGSHIAFLAVTGGNTDIHVVRADGSGLTRVTRDGLRKGRVAWSPKSGALFYTARTPNGWTIMRTAMGDGNAVPVKGTDGIAVVETDGARMFGRLAGRPGLIALDLETGAPSPGAMIAQTLEGWTVASDGLVEVRRGKSGEPAGIWRIPFQGDPRMIAQMHVPDRTNPAVSPSGDIILPETLEDEGDLMLITLGR